jgi:type I restriction enzyme, S subunit
MTNWKETTLGEVLLKRNQGVNTTTEKVVYSSVGIPVIRAQNITFGNIDFSEIAFVDADTFNRLGDSVKPNRNDVLYTNIGSQMGIASKVKQDMRFIIAWNVLRMQPRSEIIDSDFLVYFLNNPNTKQLISNRNSSSTMPFVSSSDLDLFDILLPPLPEQKAIAAILSSFDDKIELLRRQNKTLEAITQTIFKQSFVKDKSWDGNLSEYLKVQGGFAFKGEDFKEDGFAGIIKITNITMGVVDIHNSQFVDEDVVTDIDEDKFRIKGGDFLIAMTGAEIGKIGIVEKTKKQIWLNQRVGKLVAKVPYGDIVGYLALRSRDGQEHIVDAASGSAQANISSTGIEEMAFVLYSEKGTNSFGEKVKPLFEKITFNLSQIQTLSKLRDALLPKLMKGEIRIKGRV